MERLMKKKKKKEKRKTGLMNGSWVQSTTTKKTFSTLNTTKINDPINRLQSEEGTESTSECVCKTLPQSIN